MVEESRRTLVEAGAPQALPNVLGSGGWVICPGLFADSEDSNHLRDLDHRLRQAKLFAVPVEVVTADGRNEARFITGMARSKAVGLGYKLRHWAVFEVKETRFLVVYTGHNSRAR